MNIQQAIAQLIGSQNEKSTQNLTQEQSRQVMMQIMSGQATAAQIGAYVIALRMKGETIEEIAGAAQAMREKALSVSAPGTVIDTCGTGGDASGTFNISTTAAFVVAAQGVTVAKHGNRSISSKSGSADLLKMLGVRIDAEHAVVERCLQEVGIGFLFAPRHHSAMRHVAGPRQELAVRTLFNVLGPLTNPASAPFQLVGVYSNTLVEPLARVLGRLGARRAMVVHGSDGLDEITTTTKTQVAEFVAHDTGGHQTDGAGSKEEKDGQVHQYTIEPQQFGFKCATLADLRGGDAEVNAAITRRVLAGEKGPQRDIVILNAGAALSLTLREAETSLMSTEAARTSHVERVRAGVEMATEAIDSGKANHCLEQLIVVSNQI